MQNYILIAALLMFSVNSNAEEAIPAPAEDQPQTESGAVDSEATRNKDESWYFNFGLGYAAHPDYGAFANREIDNLKSISTDFKRTPITVDIGFYWPLSNSRKNAFGVSLFGVNEIIEASGYKIDITQSALAFSAISYFGENIGDGIFLRGDIGPARYSSETKTPSGATIYEARSDWGMAGQVGAGYSVPVSTETRIAAGLFFSIFRIKDDRSTNFSFQVSCLL